MRVAITGGGQEDAAHLRRIAVRRGLAVEFHERTKISVGENAARFGAETPGPQALLFEALARPDLAILALQPVREDPYIQPKNWSCQTFRSKRCAAVATD